MIYNHSFSIFKFRSKICDFCYISDDKQGVLEKFSDKTALLLQILPKSSVGYSNVLYINTLPF